MGQRLKLKRICEIATAIASMNLSKNCRPRQDSASFYIEPPDLSCLHMEKMHNTPKREVPIVSENRSRRSRIRRLFSTWFTCQRCNCADGVEKILGKQEEIHELIEIIAREMHRQAEKRKEEFDAR